MSGLTNAMLDSIYEKLLSANAVASAYNPKGEPTFGLILPLWQRIILTGGWRKRVKRRIKYLRRGGKP